SPAPLSFSTMSEVVLVQEYPAFYVPKFLLDLGFEVDPTGNGEGSLGTVKKFKNRDGIQAITIKKCTNPLESKVRAQLILRELINLRTIKHENLLDFMGSYMATDDGVMSVWYSGICTPETFALIRRISSLSLV
ncbi:hypothetical protein PMAYCL1PPCAC_14145, partial [Pristionchus mayeri]